MLQNLKDRYDKLRDDYPIDTPSALLGVENSIRSVTTIMSNGVLQNWTLIAPPGTTPEQADALLAAALGSSEGEDE